AGLLRHLGPTAQDDKRGGVAQPPEQGLYLSRQRSAPRRIFRGVVEIGQHQVLPDHDAQLVAKLMERVALVDESASHPQRADAGFPRLPASSFEPVAAAWQAYRIAWRPDRTATEARHAVDDQAEPPPIGPTIRGDATEADTA